jgi:glutamine synthetase
MSTAKTPKTATPRSVIENARKQGAKMVDVKFVDTFGTWQHFSVPMGELTEEVFEDGFGFDGSSIRGWKSIEASDMLAMPDPATAFIDPFCLQPTLSVTCTIAETGTKEAYTRDPRGMAHAARNTNPPPADTPSSGPKPNSSSLTRSIDSKSNGTFYSVDSEEAV